MSIIPKSSITTPLSKRKSTKRVMVHCADTPPTMDIGWKEINQWHVKGNGWAAIGYHVVIRRDGTIEAGRPLDTIGAHVGGHNSDSIGICLVGGKGPMGTFYDHFTKEQELSLVAVLKDLQETYGDLPVTGHNDWAAKQCPSFKVKPWWSSINDRA